MTGLCVFLFCLSHTHTHTHTHKLSLSLYIYIYICIYKTPWFDSTLHSCLFVYLSIVSLGLWSWINWLVAEIDGKWVFFSPLYTLSSHLRVFGSGIGVWVGVSWLVGQLTSRKRTGLIVKEELVSLGKQGQWRQAIFGGDIKARSKYKKISLLFPTWTELELFFPNFVYSTRLELPTFTTKTYTST